MTHIIEEGVKRNESNIKGGKIINYCILDELPECRNCNKIIIDWAYKCKGCKAWFCIDCNDELLEHLARNSCTEATMYKLIKEAPEEDEYF